MKRIEKWEENPFFCMLVLSVLAMIIMPYGSFNPSESGFWRAVFWGVFMTGWFKLIMKKGPGKDKAPDL